MLMVRQPGAARTLLARALPAILPEMSLEEALKVMRIYSVADMLPFEIPIIRTTHIAEALQYRLKML